MQILVHLLEAAEYITSSAWDSVLKGLIKKKNDSRD